MAEGELSDIQHEEHGHRGSFFMTRGDKRVARLTYSRGNERLVIIDHTEVDPSLEGRGIARGLLDAAVAWARETGTKFMVTCPYASSQFAKDPSIGDVLLA